jgi:Fe-S cluster assembly protein SufD
MVVMAAHGDRYLSQFERLERVVAGSRQAWFIPNRREAMARFLELGFPTIRDEEWRHTNVRPIAETAFEPAHADGAGLTRAWLEPFRFGDTTSLLVFVNGRYAPHLSSLRALSKGVRVGNLAEAMGVDAELVKPHLARQACFQDHAFRALNTALMEDGAFIHIPVGRVVEGPIHLLFVTSGPEQVVMTHPRNLIVMGDDSQATMVETYIGFGCNKYFTNAVTEVVVGENAVLDHYKVVRERAEAFHIATLELHQRRSSTVTSHTLTFGGTLVRNDIIALLDGEGCTCALSGLYMASGTQHVDNHLRVEHAKPHCDSREFFKGVLDERARGVFSGRIVVHEDAQKTDAKQTNMTLLLSDDAQVESKPQLEIRANDVKCTHGATVGQLSDDALFYLRSRGMNEDAARSLLVYAFAREALAHIRLQPLRTQLERLLLERLPQGQMLSEVI